MRAIRYYTMYNCTMLVMFEIIRTVGSFSPVLTGARTLTPFACDAGICALATEPSDHSLLLDRNLQPITRRITIISRF